MPTALCTAAWAVPAQFKARFDAMVGAGRDRWRGNAFETANSPRKFCALKMTPMRAGVWDARIRNDAAGLVTGVISTPVSV